MSKLMPGIAITNPCEEIILPIDNWVDIFDNIKVLEEIIDELQLEIDNGGEFIKIINWDASNKNGRIYSPEIFKKRTKLKRDLLKKQNK